MGVDLMTEIHSQPITCTHRYPNPSRSPSPPPVSPETPRKTSVVVKSAFSKVVPSKFPPEKERSERIMSKEDEITASIKAGNAISSDPKNKISKNLKKFETEIKKPKRKSTEKNIGKIIGDSKKMQPASDVPKPDSSSQKRKAFKPKQGILEHKK